MAYILSNVAHDKLANYLLNTFITVLYQKDNPYKVISTDISITLGRNVFRLTHRKIYDSLSKIKRVMIYWVIVNEKMN